MAPIHLGKLVEKALTRKWYLAGHEPGNRFSTGLDDNDDVLLEFTLNYADHYTLRVRAHQEIGFWHYDEGSGRGRKELRPLAKHLLERFGRTTGGHLSDIKFFTLEDYNGVLDKKLTADDINARL